MKITSVLGSTGLSTGLIALSTLILTLFLQSWGVFSRAELTSLDHRIEMFRSDQEINENVVVVLIDDASLQELAPYFGRWPWPRAVYADVIDYFARAGAQGLAFDILFAEQQGTDPGDENDARLVEATLDAGNVVHAMQLLYPGEGEGEGESTLPEDFRRLFGLDVEQFAGPEYRDALLPFEFLYLVSRGTGFVEVVPDRDGVYRRIRLFNRHRDGTVLPSLAAALVLPLFGSDYDISVGLEEAQYAGGRVPLDGNGNVLINPYGGMQTVSIAEVIRSQRQIRSGDPGNPELDPAQFAGKLILLGASAIGLLDVKATSLGAAQPGVFLHAWTVSNLLNQDFLTEPGPTAEIILILCLAGLCALPLLLWARLLIATLVPLFIGALYLISAYAAFPFNLVMPVTPVVFALVLALVLGLMIRSHRQSLGVLGPDASTPSSAADDLHSPGGDDAAAGAMFATLSVLSVGIRHNRAQQDPPGAEQVVASLELCMTELAAAIENGGGRVDQLTDDSIRAYWDADKATAGHNARALMCALDLNEKLPAINNMLADRDCPGITLGMGIHSGKAVLGELRHGGHSGYCVIGEVVQLARELQLLSLQRGLPILLSEAVRQGMESTVPIRPVETLEVRGAAETYAVFTLSVASQPTG